METVVRDRRMYEAMFLVDSADAAGDWDGVLAACRNVLTRAGAEIVSLKKWDERKLAYDIGGKSRGTYILAYFRSDGGKIGGIERDVQLSERIMRVLVLKADHITPADIEKQTPTVQAEQAAGAGQEQPQTEVSGAAGPAEKSGG